MHDRGVVAAAKFPADLRQRTRRQLLGEVHRDLAGASDGASATVGGHLAESDIEMLGHPLLDFVDRHAPFVRAEEIVQDFVGALERDITPDQLR